MCWQNYENIFLFTTNVNFWFKSFIQGVPKQAEKLKSREMRKDEWRMMKDEWRMTKDERWTFVTDICDFRFAFATENVRISAR